MLRSYQVNLIALGLAGLIAVITGITLYSNASALQSGYERNASERAKQYSNQAAKDLKACVPSSAGRLKCQSEANERAREGQRKEYELEAQRVTAVWTAHTGIAAMIGMAVSFFGVGLVWTTFRETQKSNDLSAKHQRAWLQVLVEIKIGRAHV